MVNEFEEKMIQEIVKQMPVSDAYKDVAKPALESTGQLLGFVPRAINAALEPLHIWILQKEYNISETRKLLEEKLKNVSPEKIVPPESYIAVPALQAISYCMNNNVLRDMYASLLASSMTSDLKNSVHPAYVEVIKQLSPDEAKILSILSVRKVIPVIWLKRVFPNKKGEAHIVRNFSTIGEIARCEMVEKTPEYLENLARLKLVNLIDDAYLTKDNIYDELITHPYITQKQSIVLPVGHEHKIVKGYVEISVFGNSFCEICVTNQYIKEGQGVAVHGDF